MTLLLSKKMFIEKNMFQKIKTDIIVKSIGALLHLKSEILLDKKSPIKTYI